MTTTQPAQQQTDLAQAGVVLWHVVGRRARRRTAQQHFHAVGVDRIAGAQQCHAAHRASIDMDAADSVGHLQPQAALVQTELRQQQCALRIVNHPHAAGGMTDDPVDAGLERMIRLLPVSEMNLQIAHPP